jgi:hypothetical protein
MRITPNIFGTLVLVIFLGVILAFQAAGIWSVSGKTTGTGEAVQPSAQDVKTIKGWMTLEQISTTYHVPLADILVEFDLPSETPASSAIKDLESDVFSVTLLRTWLQSRAQPAQPENTAAPVQQMTSAPVEAVTTPLPTQHIAADKTITGKTTFQELIEWGVSEDVIRQIIGGDLPERSTAIKDYVTQKGLEFAPVKAALQAEVDKTQ